MLSSLSRSPTLLEARAAAGSGGPEREREREIYLSGPGSVHREGMVKSPPPIEIVT